MQRTRRKKTQESLRTAFPQSVNLPILLLILLQRQKIRRSAEENKVTGFQQKCGFSTVVARVIYSYMIQ